MDGYQGIRRFGFVLFLCFVVFPLQAEELGEIINRCSTAAKWSSVEWEQAAAACYHREHERLDALLNGEYQTLMNWLSGKMKQDLIELERAWVAYKESFCKFTATTDLSSLRTRDGGQPQWMPPNSLKWNECMTKLTLWQFEQIQSLSFAGD